MLETPFGLGGLNLPNRVIMAPMTRNRAGKGLVPHALNAEYYMQRATAGLIITEPSSASLTACRCTGRSITRFSA